MNKDVLGQLSDILQGALFFDRDIPAHQTMCMAYATDASIYQELPLAVAIPEDESDIQKLIEFAQIHRVTLIPRTAGTSLAGQVVGNGIVLDMSRCFTDILELNEEEGWVRVQPGVIRDDLNAFLKPFGLMFGPETSTASRAMIGGMVGNNSSGLHSIVWGDTRQNLLSAVLLLDDGSRMEMAALLPTQLLEKLSLNTREGEIYRKLNDLLKNKVNRTAIAKGYPKKTLTRRNTGYALDLLAEEDRPFDLCQLLAGSEGTLGIMLEAKLKLMSLPPAQVGVLCVHFTDMISCMHGNVVALQHAPQASELIDKYILDFTVGHPTYQHNRFFISGDPAALLIVEFRADTVEGVFAQAEALKLDLQTQNLGYAYPLVIGDQSQLVWDVRKAGLGLIRNLPGDAQPVNLIEDCAVAPEDLPAYVSDVQALLAEEGVQASYYAHAGAGELHIEPFLNLKSSQGVKQFRDILEKTTDLVLKYNGSLSGEHGDGRLRGEFIGKVLGKEVYALLQQVKYIFDPSGIFNSQKIVDTPPMDTALRYEVGNPQEQVTTYFDFTKQEGILRLAEKCSGSGDCRKTEVSGGTMCPSFMATRDEKDTTRARANILRQFLTSSAQKNRFAHQEIKEVMDLCLSCKACKTECPSQVDMAKMKAEFLQQYYDQFGPSFRSRVVANFTKSQQLASMVAPLYNAVVRSPMLSSGVKRVLGFAEKRSLPTVGNTTLKQWHAKKAKPQFTDRQVYLFCDEFTNYNDVAIGKKAILLLEKLGYEVIIPNHKESGRTYLSKGFVKEAKQLAKYNVQALSSLITEKIPLIGIEPSAILTFRDEYLDLADAGWKLQAQHAAQHALTIDEFLDREMSRGNIAKTAFTMDEKRLKIHGHCYQKAFQLMQHTSNIVSFPANYHIELIPSGCCGMAGSFGYEKEHYEVSMKIAELVLLPAVREADTETLIVAAGTSCRHQVADGTHRRAYHPVEILYDALV
ncbi:FAD-binding protein [Sphingobacterium sp. lm-10]|uniref:FAD-binding and (Fe-S)-binding domain-containing protein n=1 Tax=Sphingobacterium sp. lm-10 TaxID=2944904 RepID=UPI002021A56E|nr:FAD-binding and (Fe-S)-binding domain-containing protein [Sphingobacterium sp. lm-10]MCL7987557.1 FAD-binding protein [Sphingobacterium sp. lm-10]